VKQFVDKKIIQTKKDIISHQANLTPPRISDYYWRIELEQNLIRLEGKMEVLEEIKTLLNNKQD
jgi:hypothetical protein